MSSLSITALKQNLANNIYSESQLQGMIINLKGQNTLAAIAKFNLVNKKLKEMAGEPKPAELIPNESFVDFEEYIANKFLQVKNNAKERGIPFNLKLYDVRNLLRRKTCVYTKRKFQPSGDYKLTFDRKDHTKGYTKDNVVACSYWANQAKNNIFERSDSMFKDHIGDLKALLQTMVG